MTARRARIYGRVQGVFFRAWTVKQAEALGVRGWVRNRGDGSVELLACGPAEAVDALIERCRSGPPAAKVERIDWEVSDDPDLASFTKERTV